LPREILDRLAAHFEVDLWDSDLPPDADSLRERVVQADGLFSLLTDRIDAALLAAAPSLKVVSNMAVGTDNIDLAAATALGIPVGNTPGVLTETTADFTFALLMAAARRIVDGDGYIRAGHWKTWGPNVLLGRDLFGATLGIVGFGAIGQAVARRAQGFSMRVLYTRRSAAPPPPGVDAASVSLDDLLRESDFVSLHVPLTEETRHMIGSREMALMKETAILVNTARGGVVDQGALVEALRRGRPAVAALDVTAVEPIDSQDELLTLPNVVITPHIASASVATRLRMANMAVDNLLAGLSGAPLPNCANPEVY
jgi:lactate dehydrogenase-like 2-hydroxyacid dehydrogenase